LALVAVSVRPPFERRDAHLPLRRRPDLLAELSGGLMRIDSQPHVRVLHGLNGCGKT
jgi:hypothetical protein